MPVAISIAYGIGGSGMGMLGDGVQALQEFKAVLERAGDNVGRFMQYTAPDLFKAFEKEARRQFAGQGGGPAGGTWRPLSKAYAKWKRVHYPGKPLLVRTGELKAALTQSSGANALRDYNDTSANFGTQYVPYASFHQTGTGRMPARPPLDFSTDFTDRLPKLVQAGIIKAIRAADAADLLGVRES